MMKRIILFQMIMNVCLLEASTSMVSKSIEYLDMPGQKAAVSHSQKYLSKKYPIDLASAYWDFLTTGKGDFYYLFSSETNKVEYAPLGLTQEDIAEIKNYIIKFKLTSNVQYFAFLYLPTWLARDYQNVNKEVLQIAKADRYNFLGPREIRIGIAEFIVQDWYLKREHRNKYMYIKTDVQSAQIEALVEREQNTIKHILDNAKNSFVFIDNIQKNIIGANTENERTEYIIDEMIEYIIIQADLNALPPAAEDLRIILEQHPTLKVIIAFNEGQLSTPYGFTIHNIPNPNIANQNTADQKLIESVIITGNLALIGDKFMKNRNLKKLELPNSVIRIKDEFLEGCSKLEDVKLSNSLRVIENNFLVKCVNLEKLQLASSLVKIGNYCCGDCNLRKLDLPRALLEIGDNFLAYCNQLKNLELPASLIKIGNNFLYYCIGIIHLVIPNSVREIGDGFLEECWRLKTLQLSDNIINIGNNFLKHCYDLEKLIIPEQLYYQFYSIYHQNQTNFSKLKDENIKVIYKPKLNPAAKPFIPKSQRLNLVF